MFTRPQIRKLLTHSIFKEKQIDQALIAWNCLVNIVKRCLDKIKMGTTKLVRQFSKVY